MPSKTSSPFGIGLLLLALLWLAGCQSASKSESGANARLFQPSNYQGVPSLPSDIQRIVVLPTAGDGLLGEESLHSLDDVVLKALNQTRRFECVPVPREVCARYTRQRAVRSVDMLPHDFFPRLANEYGAGAVLFVDITHYNAYPPLAIGFRSKLVRLDNRTILWSFDETFAANLPEVARSARQFWQETTQSDSPANLGATALQSPTRFAAYVVHAAFSTLPQRFR